MDIVLSQESFLLDPLTGEVLRKYPKGTRLCCKAPEEQDQSAFYAARDRLGFDPRYRTFDGDVEHGSFTWFRCEAGEPLSLPVGNADLVRLFLLSTYSTYKGKLVASNTKPLGIQECADIFGVSYGGAAATLSRLEEANMIKRESGVYWINQKVFCRGKLSTRWAGRIGKAEATTVRIYHEQFRWLYNNCERQRAGRLSYVIKLIPYLRHDMNAVCSYPLCPELADAEPQTITRAAKLLGKDSPNYRQFKNAIDEETLILPDGSPAVAQVQMDGMSEDKRYLVVNPHLIYGGTDFDAVDALICGESETEGGVSDSEEDNTGVC